MFQAVVRTTQPEIKGSRVRPVRPVPGKLVDKIVELTKLRPIVLDALAEPPPLEVREANVNVLAAARSSSDDLADAVRRKLVAAEDGWESVGSPAQLNELIVDLVGQSIVTSHGY